MQLDKTRIMIRERGYLDLLELALVVIRNHAAPLAACFFIAAAPFFALNHWVITSRMEIDAEYDQELYIAWQLVLIAFEAPWATALVTIYLGQAMFIDRPTAGKVVSDFFRCLGQLLFFQFFLRGLSSLPCFVGLFIAYMVWPYANEVILLERNKLGGTWKRLANLHEQSGGLVASRWFAALCAGGTLWGSLTMACGYIRNQLFQTLRGEYYVAVIDVPLSLWLVIGFFAVVRYLCYLDLRIRREGWEIELKMRAEAARLNREGMGARA